MHPRRSEETSAFRDVPHTGVIYVMEQASKAGFVYGHPDWANLGQGAPETGDIPDCPPRMETMHIDQIQSEYAPVAGLRELREAVATLYNERYRKGKTSLYTYENVAISAGGRAGLARIVAALSGVNLGHFLPDYTAYEELLDLYRAIVPIPITSDTMGLPTPERLRFEIMSRGLGAILLSNPVNPTGCVVAGEELKGWLEQARMFRCALIFDEFYSHYLYDPIPKQQLSLSASEYVEDVNHDPVIIVDGLTKNWRYPGLRLSWTLGPKKVIDAVSSAGSFLDGGAAHPIQKAAFPLIKKSHADKEAQSIRAHFSKKRAYMQERLQEWGMAPDEAPRGGFYFFPSLSNLPEPLQDGMRFFEEALKEQVITVPGVFFDVNPGGRRDHLPSRLKSYLRLSYGPPMPELERGLDRLGKIIRRFQ